MCTKQRCTDVQRGERVVVGDVDRDRRAHPGGVTRRNCGLGDGLTFGGRLGDQADVGSIGLNRAGDVGVNVNHFDIQRQRAGKAHPRAAGTGGRGGDELARRCQCRHMHIRAVHVGRTAQRGRDVGGGHADGNGHANGGARAVGLIRAVGRGQQHGLAAGGDREVARRRVNRAAGDARERVVDGQTNGHRCRERHIAFTGIRLVAGVAVLVGVVEPLLRFVAVGTRLARRFGAPFGGVGHGGRAAITLGHQRDGIGRHDSVGDDRRCVAKHHRESERGTGAAGTVAVGSALLAVCRAGDADLVVGSESRRATGRDAAARNHQGGRALHHRGRHGGVGRGAAGRGCRHGGVGDLDVGAGLGAEIVRGRDVCGAADHYLRVVEYRHGHGPYGGCLRGGRDVGVDRRLEFDIGGIDLGTALDVDQRPGVAEHGRGRQPVAEEGAAVFAEGDVGMGEQLHQAAGGREVGAAAEHDAAAGIGEQPLHQAAGALGVCVQRDVRGGQKGSAVDRDLAVGDDDDIARQRGLQATGFTGDVGRAVDLQVVAGERRAITVENHLVVAEEGGDRQPGQGAEVDVFAALEIDVDLRSEKCGVEQGQAVDVDAQGVTDEVDQAQGRVAHTEGVADDVDFEVTRIVDLDLRGVRVRELPPQLAVVADDLEREVGRQQVVDIDDDSTRIGNVPGQVRGIAVGDVGRQQHARLDGL